MPKIAVIGDGTSHGGKIISGSGVASINGKAIACVGDKVLCPLLYPDKRPHGINAILDGAGHYQIDGKAVAIHGSKTECGCTLIATGEADLQ